MSYGYEPPKQDSSGSWGEIFTITRVVFELLAPFLAVILGVLMFIVVTVVLMSLQLLLGLIPITLATVGAVWVLRQERQQADAEAARIWGD
jgi:hypothetical protein